MPKFKYKGCDWTEVLDCICEKECDLPDEMAGDLLEEYVGISIRRLNSPSKDEKKNGLKIVKKIRRFVVVISKKNEYKAPMWRGISEITDHETFLKAFLVNYRDMWT